MALDTALLIAEADRLIARAERERERHRSESRSASVDRAERELKRLQLYRAILTSRTSAHALMPEYVVARGLLRSDNGET